MSIKPFVSRECPYGHGPLETLTGWWALQGVHVRTPEQTTEIGGPDEMTVGQTGTAYALRLRHCKDCGLVLLFDEDVR